MGCSKLLKTKLKEAAVAPVGEPSQYDDCGTETDSNDDDSSDPGYEESEDDDDDWTDEESGDDASDESW